jgi:hypothetical protein
MGRMMKGDLTMATKRTELDEILEAYAGSDSGPNREALIDWTRRFPQYQQELTEFTVRWSMLRWLPDKDEDRAIPEETLILRGMSAIQSVLYRYQQGKREGIQVRVAEGLTSGVVVNQSPRQIPGLLKEGKRVGLSAHALAERLGVSDALLRKLDRRLINPKSVPQAFNRELANALGCQMEQVVAYSQHSPTFAAGAQHSAQKAPTLPTQQEDFVDAVRNDMTLTGEQKAKLVLLASPPK